MPRVEDGNLQNLIQTAIPVIRCGLIPGGNSTRRLNFARRRLIFVDPPSEILLHVTLLVPRIFEVDRRVLANLFILVTDCRRCFVKVNGTG